MKLTKFKRYVLCIGFITTFCHLIFLICSQLMLISMTISQGRNLNFTLYPIIQMSEQIVFRFMILNFGTVYPKTLQIQHLSQYLKNDVLSLCIMTLKFLFIFSYYFNLCCSFFLFYFVLDIRYVFLFFSLYIIFFLLRIPTIHIYIYFHIFNCYVCNLATIMFICTDFIEVDNWNDNIVDMDLW